MSVLIVKNVTSEGPGTIEEYLRAGKTPYSIAELYRGERIHDPSKYTHLVVMGGPMAVYEMDQYPFLRDEAKLIEQFVLRGRNVLGVCLGAQMVAQVLGGRVYAGGKKEIGWHQVALTPEGIRDRIMASLAVNGSDSAHVFQWHGDTFDIPAGALRLASSELFPNQAFRYSSGVYALQFHIEVTPAIVADWLTNERGVDLGRVNAESGRVFEAYRARAMQFYRGFFKP